MFFTSRATFINIAMKDLLEKNNFSKPLQIGKIIEGKIIGKGRSAIFLDLGAFGTGIIYGKEFQETKEKLKDLKIGDTVFAKIVDLENEEGYIELSLSQASNELIWEELQQKKEKAEQILVKILGANKGGLLTDVSGIGGFLPVSQLLPEHYPRVEKGETSQILKELQKFIGKEMEVKIFDLDKKQGKLILSEKSKEDEKIKKLLEKYKTGDIVEGEITGVTDFGAFMKFSLIPAARQKRGETPLPSAESSKGKKNAEEKEFELEGLIHISEIDWQLIEDPSEFIKVGQKLKAKIIEISNGKVSLSLKALKKDPWENIEQKHKKGDVIEGKVTKFNPFGAFVQFEDKIQGLVHISEFATQKKMTETLEINKKYKFQILQIEPKEHRMSLKLASDK